jgi:hypothetical protein
MSYNPEYEILSHAVSTLLCFALLTSINTMADFAIMLQTTRFYAYLEAKLEAIMDDVHTRIEKKREAKP